MGSKRAAVGCDDDDGGGDCVELGGGVCGCDRLGGKWIQSPR